MTTSVIGGSPLSGTTLLRVMMLLSLLSLCVFNAEAFTPFPQSYRQADTCLLREIKDEERYRVVSRSYRQAYTCCCATSKDEEARRLKEGAERLRAEVASFEKEKKDMEREERRQQEELSSQKQQIRMRYSAEVPILKGDGSTVMERVDFPPLIKDGRLIVVLLDGDCCLLHSKGYNVFCFHIRRRFVKD